jgi:hypothetical protein
MKILLRAAFLVLSALPMIGQSMHDVDTNANGEEIVFSAHGGIEGAGHNWRKETAKPAFQDEEVPQRSWMPRPFLFSGGFGGGSYAFLSPIFGGGLLLNASKLTADFEASYGTARKTDDGTINNREGHERFLKGRLFYRYRNFYFGGGAQWSETATTNYTKKSWRPTFGFGGDHLGGECNCRWQILYILPGTDYANGVQGPEFELWLPSPATKHHWFFRFSSGQYEFHTTVTDPSNEILTARQRGQRGYVGFTDAVFGWRF